MNGPGSDVMLEETTHGGGRRGVCTSDTPAEACPVAGHSLALIGRRALVGGSAVNADWPHAIDAGDSPSSGVWIAFIRQDLEDSKSIVPVPVTGSLTSPTVFSCRDIASTDRFLRDCIICDKDGVLPAGYQVLLQQFDHGRGRVIYGGHVWCRPVYPMGCAGDGDGSRIGYYGAITECAGCVRDDRPSRQRERESFKCLFQTAEVWIRCDRG